HTVCHYQLYLMYAEMGNAGKSEYHKNVLLTKYPDSDYAKVILNPNYAQAAAQKDEEVEKLYEEAYVYFEQGFYREAYKRIMFALEEHPNSSFEPQLKLLEALCYGYLDSEDRMLSE